MTVSLKDAPQENYRRGEHVEGLHKALARSVEKGSAAIRYRQQPVVGVRAERFLERAGIAAGVHLVT
jgi:hypothetical protein